MLLFERIKKKRVRVLTKKANRTKSPDYETPEVNHYAASRFRSVFHRWKSSAQTETARAQARDFSRTVLFFRTGPAAVVREAGSTVDVVARWRSYPGAGVAGAAGVADVVGAAGTGDAAAGAVYGIVAVRRSAADDASPGPHPDLDPASWPRGSGSRPSPCWRPSGNERPADDGSPTAACSFGSYPAQREKERIQEKCSAFTPEDIRAVRRVPNGTVCRHCLQHYY